VTSHVRNYNVTTCQAQLGDLPNRAELKTPTHSMKAAQGWLMGAHGLSMSSAGDICTCIANKALVKNLLCVQT